jgi:hypothetical protein
MFLFGGTRQKKNGANQEMLQFNSIKKRSQFVFIPKRF